MRKFKSIDTRDIIQALGPDYFRGHALDIGAGNGRYKAMLSPYFSKYETADIVHDADYVVDAAHIPVADNTFDTVVSFQTLEHVEDERAVVSEMYRVLKPGGRAVVTAPFLTAQHNDPTDFRRYSKDGMALTLRRAGFEIVEIGSYGGLFAAIGSFIRFTLTNPTKDPMRKPRGRVARKISHWSVKLFVWLDRMWTLDEVVYGNVYAVARKR